LYIEFCSAFKIVDLLVWWREGGKGNFRKMAVGKKIKMGKKPVEASTDKKSDSLGDSHPFYVSSVF